MKNEKINLKDSDSNQAAQDEFIKTIERKVSGLLGKKLDGEFKAVNYPAGFNYGIKDGYFYNEKTLNTLDTILQKNKQNQIIIEDTRFSQQYMNILKGITYKFSKKDAEKIAKSLEKSSTQATAVIREFEAKVGTIPSENRKSAIEYIFNYVADNYGEINEIPSSLSNLRINLLKFEQVAKEVLRMYSNQYDATERLDSAIENIKNPNETNGGYQTNDEEYYVGFDRLPSTSDLVNHLNNKKNKIDISLTMETFDSKSTNLKINGKAALSIPIANIFRINIGGSGSYDMSSYTDNRSKVEISISYEGISTVACVPLTLNSKANKGWYDSNILKEIIKKDKKEDITGYTLNTEEFDVNDLFGINKEFSRLKTFVICREPTIKIKLTNGSTKKFKEELTQDAKIGFSVLSFFSFNISESYKQTKVEEDTKSSSITLTFEPTTEDTDIPFQDKIAYVLGGVPSYPPNNI